MNKKSILIFGGGLNQYRLIEEAKNLGVTSVVIDPLGDVPGRKIADYFYVVAGDDYEKTKEIALKHKVDGLVTTQMEKPMRLMARLAKDLGLKFHTPEVVERSLDKWLMKQAFLANDVPCAKGKLFLRNQKITPEDLQELNYPLIIKPKDATSSQGVYRIEQFDEIKKYENITRSFSRNGEVIIEEFLEGPEFSIESITYKDETIICQFTEKFITPFPTTVEMGHLQPADLTEEQKEKISVVVKKAIKAIGIDNSASHAEIKLTPSGPKMIEIGARGGGDLISSYLTLTSTGISMDKAIIQVALGEEPDLNQKWNQYSYIKYFELPVGKQVKEIKNYDDILKEEFIVLAHIAVKPGDVIKPITESKRRPGFVIIKGISKDFVLETAANYELKLKQKIILS